MKSKVTFLLVCLLFQLSMWNLPSVSSANSLSSRIIYVPGNYSTIQAGINGALPGDTVFVQSGTYYEHVVVNKSISLIGEQPETAFIDGSGNGTVVLVTSSNTVVSNFTIRDGIYGILVERANNVVIRKNNVSNNREGITL